MSRWARALLVTACSAVLLVACTREPATDGGAGVAAGADDMGVAIDADDIGGVVRSSSGPEAGVWVIAETDELPTGYRKIVVTDDDGRYVLPDLPRATYRVWVRGYGLVDSEAVEAQPGQHLALTAVPAPSAQAAAQYYPANYWLSLMNVPPDDEFPLAPPAGATLSRAAQQRGGVATQGYWVATVKGCEICHQLGSRITREISPEMGAFESSVDAWDHRIRMGQSGANMLGTITSLGRERTLQVFADWTDRIAAGAVPPAPPRPKGVERNVVITQWDIAAPTSFLHDFYGTDKRDPTVNANGPLIAGDFNLGNLWVLDPNANTVKAVDVPHRDPLSDIRPFSPPTMQFPSLYWGDELVANERQKTEVQNVDPQGRLWMMTAWRGADNPDYCKEGSDNKFAQNYPLARGGRQMATYDLKTGEFRLIDTCFTTHHGIFAEDEDSTFYNAALGLPSAIGWVKTRVFDETGDAKASQGWCPAYYDVNGNGTYDKDADRLVGGNGYYITWNPVDGSVWYAYPNAPGMIIRIDVGSNPPATCRTEAYAPPFYNSEAPGEVGSLPRGIDVDRNGLIWTALAGSGHLASFDRSKCAIKEGPETFDPQHCPEGWTLYPVPGPQMGNVKSSGSADFMYSNFVDQFNVFGLGANVPFATGTGSDSVLALLPETKQWVVIRVPYPMGFYTRNMTARIDDPDAGWKGRGLWAANEVRNPWHIEGGKGTTPKAAHFQLRPDPLAH